MVTLAVLLVDWPLPPLGAWLAVMTASLAWRLMQWRRFGQAAPGPDEMRPWEVRLSLGAGATGLCWGLVGYLFYDPAAGTSQFFVPFILAGMVAGSATALTGHLPAFLAFGSGALLPFALRLLQVGEATQLAMAALILLYMAGVAYLGRSYALSVRESVLLAAERSDLVAALRERSAQLEATLDSISQGVAVFERDGRLMMWNHRHRDLHGYPLELYRQGCPLADFLTVDAARGNTSAADAELLQMVTGARGAAPRPVRFEQAGAGGRILEVEHRPMPDGGFVSTSTDITERKRDEERMLRLAQHDPVTGLPNRLLFEDRLAQAIARSRRSGDPLALMLLDLDRFKAINDAYGHAAGDAALRELGRRVAGALRESDTVARIGGDEFALILPGVSSAEDAAALAAKVLARIEPPLRLEGEDVHLAVSLGVALFPQDGRDGEELLRRADAAMYGAKAAGGGYRLFGGSAPPSSGHRLRLQREIGAALAAGELSVVYQPQKSLGHGRITGVEALLRWRHPDLGLLDTELVIRVAEASGDILAIGEWTLLAACRAAASWPGSLPVAVNVATTQLRQPGFAATVARILGEAGLAPQRLELEVVETTVLDEIEQVAASLDEVRALGVRLSLDDFGTGFASLSHLRRFPLHGLKIDRSFIAGLDEPASAAIVQSMIELGHRLGLRVIAEGVESEAQLAVLRRLGCDEAQGHAIARPMLAAELEAWLRQRPEIGGT
jgi:diguanylate cyclase (GGDEF)-like protein